MVQAFKNGASGFRNPFHSQAASQECCHFDRLQGEIGEWSQRNFPNNTPADPWEGIIEEVGELATATLAISLACEVGDPTAPHAAEHKDAVADAIIYAFDYCNRREFGVHSILWHDAGLGCRDFRGLQEAAAMGRECSFLQLRLMSALGKVAHSRLKLRQGIRVNEDHIGNERRALGEVFAALALICNRYHYDMQEIVDTTWAKVSQRDWTKNKADGLVALATARAEKMTAEVRSHGEAIKELLHPNIIEYVNSIPDSDPSAWAAYQRREIEESEMVADPAYVSRLNTLVDDDQTEPYTATVPTRKTMPYED